MNLDQAQREKLAAWIAEGLKLSEIQGQLVSEFGMRLTYMEVRLLVDDLKLTPKDPKPDPKPAKAAELTATPPVAEDVPEPAQAANPPTPDGATGGGKVSVTVDQLARPGAIVSGKVTFSDGQQADWYLDQTGRLGVVPKEPGYKPAPADVQQFQMALEGELAKIGF